VHKIKVSRTNDHGPCRGIRIYGGPGASSCTHSATS